MPVSQTNTRVIVLAMYTVGFIDLFGVSLVVPLLSKHIRELGASPTVVGLISSLYGGLQLFSSPLVGKWSDRSGRKFVLLWCLFASMIGYSTLGYADTILVVLLARILVGIFKHPQELVRGYLAHIIPKSEHSTVFGRFNSCGSIGFILGPAIGGHIGELENGFYYNASLCAFVYFLNVILVWAIIPESFNGNLDKKERSSKSNPGFFASFKDVNWNNLWDIFLVKFLMGFAIMVYRSNFAMMLDYKYEASSTTVGYILSYTGLIGTFSGFFVGKVADFYQNDAKMLLHVCIIQAFAILGITFSPSLWTLLFFMTPMSIANAVARVASTNITIARGKGQETGVLLGLSGTVLSFARMASPAIGGVAQELHLSGPGIVGTVVAAIAVVVLMVVPQDGRGDVTTGGGDKKEL